MAEKAEAPLGTTDAAHAATEIAYCPNLGLYHYRRADGSEEIFDRVQLTGAIDSFIAQKQIRVADYMAKLTGHARRYPHVFVILYPDGTFNLRRMEIPEEERVSGIIEDSVTPPTSK